ncbi:MAG TPA: M20/M25/M40 family metallo-hydrolase [Gemmatimonadaceae bacterium]|nr:M20/M25/M40 family metallo-hydrolase [Gemmatimonadaceae bacterium]
MRAIVIAMVAAMFGARPAAAQALSPDEQKIKSYIEQHQADEIALLEHSVNIKSQTMDFAGVRAVGALYRGTLDSLGFETRWITMPDSVNRAGHLFAERKGTRGKRVLLIGHLDTVLEGDELRWSRHDSIAAGAGSSDMKGGDVVILYALKALDSIGALDGTRIIVAMTGDEESAGDPLSMSRGDLIDAGKRSDVALAFEGGSRDNATVARRGASGWILTVTGHQAHSAGIFNPRVGYGAVFEAARILDGFRRSLVGQEYLTFNPAIILGGADVSYDTTRVSGSASTKLNIIAPKVIVHGDLRFISEEQKTNARAQMREIATHDHLPGTSAEISFQDEYPAMSPTKANYALLATFDSVSRALGYGPVKALDAGRRGAGDVSFVAPYVTGLDGLGVSGDGAHTPKETVDLNSLPMATERAAVLIYRLTHEQTGRAAHTTP